MVMGCNLTDEELAFFGVERKREGGYLYVVPCDVCGKPVKTVMYSTTRSCRCRECKSKDVSTGNKIKKMAKEYHGRIAAQEFGIDYEHYKRFEDGAEIFGQEYSDDIERAKRLILKFDSVPEVIACIELLHIGANFVFHQKVERLVVDFFFQDEKIVLEIDGSLYHSDPNKVFKRDLILKNTLGDGWKIKHIPSDTLKKNHKLFGKSMSKLIDERRFELNIK